jgi:probable DNA metabolism protein
MSNWRIVNNTYLYDGTIEGLFNIINSSLNLKIIPQNIIAEDKYIDNLIEVPVFIVSSHEKFSIISNLIKNISTYSLYNIYTAFLSDNENKENIILKYALSVLKYGSKFDYMKNNDNLIAINNISKKVVRESHKLKGFLRFKEIKSNILYAEIEPENNVIEVLAKHFKERLKNEVWIIKDKKRNLVTLYNKKEYIILKSNGEIDKLINNTEEELYQKLWKNYFNDISIKERKNLKVQMNFMPKKYWKNLIEMEDITND